MSDRLNIIAEPRDVSDEKAKHLRNEGWIPAVVYGHGDNFHIKVENLQLRRVLRDAGMTNLIDLQVGSSSRTVLAKDVQTHPTRGDLIHVDFYEVDMSEKLVVEAALISIGIAAPVSDGLGTTSLLVHAVEIECLPDNLISEIEVDLNLIRSPDDVITVAHLSVPEGVAILTDPEVIVARFDYLQVEAEEEEEAEEGLLFAEAAADVEVITKGKHVEEGEFDE